MPTVSTLPFSARASRGFGPRRIAAWLVARAIHPATGQWLVVAFAALHAVLWTLILVELKTAQDIHMDVAEAFAWGQKFLLGYGKHPPLAGWVAGLWFRLFPVRDWSAYALAMTVVSLGLVICWFIALRVVDRRRAFFVVLMLAAYPIFNFKGFKYNPDLLQLVTLPLVVLAYLDAFSKRSWISGVWLGLAAALALMTKYWVLTMIGAIGLAALMHPERLGFLRSPAPWTALITVVLAMLPHLVWLYEAHFAPLIYAGDVYSWSDRAEVLRLVLGYLGHNAALLALTLALAALAIALGWPRTRYLARMFGPAAKPAANPTQSLNIWLIQLIVAIGPPLGALAFSIYLKTDWGISLFFLVPLALLAIPSLRLPLRALFNLATIWLVLTLLTLAGSPWIGEREMAANPNNTATYGARSELARELTEAWHARFGSRWPIVAGSMETIQPMAFYSPDHPSPFTPGELWNSGLTAPEDLPRLGFIAVFDSRDERLPAFEKWILQAAPDAERLVMTTRRFSYGKAGPAITWRVYIAGPAK